MLLSWMLLEVDELEVGDNFLHLFSDASEDGCGMFAYLRFLHRSGAIKCSPVRPIAIETFSIRFFMGNRKPETAVCG